MLISSFEVDFSFSMTMAGIFSPIIFILQDFESYKLGEKNDNRPSPNEKLLIWDLQRTFLHE